MLKKFGKGFISNGWAVLLLSLPMIWLPDAAAALRVTVSAQGDSPEARGEAMAKAVDQAVQRLTGRPIGAPSRLREQASEYVLSYRLKRDVNISQRSLEIVLDDDRLAKDLPGFGLHAWREGRPEILVWVAVDEGGGRRWLDAELDGAWLAKLNSRARALGYKLLFPLNDLEDQRSLPIAALWGEADVQVRQAAKRYAASTVLAGRLQTVGPQRWSSVWNLYTDVATRWENQSGSVSRALVSAFDGAAEALAIAGQPVDNFKRDEKVLIDVAGVRDLRDYSALNKLLNGLRMVKSHSARSAQGERLRIEVTLNGGQLAFLEALKVGGLLQSAPALEGGGSNVLWYRLKN